MSKGIGERRNAPDLPYEIPSWIDGLALNVGKASFGSHLISVLSDAVGAQDCAAFRYDTDGAQTLAIGSMRNIENTRLAAQRYENEYWNRDRYLLAHRIQMRTGGPAIYNISADQIGDKNFRQNCYDFQDVAEQASVRLASSSGIFSLSAFWGHNRRPGERELERLAATARGLMSFVVRHSELSTPSRSGRAVLLEEAERLIRLLGGGLSEREIAVCSRIIRGLTMHGVATDLGLSFHSVVTYKRRAFSRLHIATTAELFSLCMPNTSIASYLGSTPYRSKQKPATR